MMKFRLTGMFLFLALALCAPALAQQTDEKKADQKGRRGRAVE